MMPNGIDSATVQRMLQMQRERLASSPLAQQVCTMKIFAMLSVQGFLMRRAAILAPACMVCGVLGPDIAHDEFRRVESPQQTGTLVPAAPKPWFYLEQSFWLA